jgi:hypothetical protein
MGLRFRQRIKIIPGIHLNVSFKGVSLSVGGPGATVNFSRKHGARATVGIPGTGLSYQTSLSKTRKAADPATEFGDRSQSSPPNFKKQYTTPARFDPIASASVEDLAKHSQSELRTMICESYNQRLELDRELAALEEDVAKTEGRFYWVDNWIGRNLFKSRYLANKEAVQNARDEVSAAKEFLVKHGLKIDWELEPEIASRYQRLFDAFADMRTAAAVWNNTARRELGYHERIVERTIRGSTIHNIRVRCDFERPVYLPPGDNEPWKRVPTISKENGTKIYIFPGFLIFEESGNFAVVDPLSIEVSYFNMHFIETKTVPADAEVVGNTWTYANKDGSPDRRYSNNAPIPIANYACVRLFAAGLINEEFMVSNVELGLGFGEALDRFFGWFRLGRADKSPPDDSRRAPKTAVAVKEVKGNASWIPAQQENRGAAGFSRMFDDRFEVTISLQLDVALWVSVTPINTDEGLVWPADENPVSWSIDGRTFISSESLIRGYRDAEEKPPFEPVQGGASGVAIRLFKYEEREEGALDEDDGPLAQLIDATKHEVLLRLQNHELIVLDLEIDDFAYLFKSLLAELSKNLN